MKRHLFMFSVGPVFDFIKASRRTRDLHFSSWFVAQMARKAAQAIIGLGAEPVVPASFEDGSPVSDRILLHLKDGIDPADASAIGCNAAITCWREFARDILQKHGDSIGIKKETWTKQLEDENLVEFFSAWVRYDGNSDVAAYPVARAKVERLLNAREATSEFKQWFGPSKVQKSSLDGCRETVLEKGDAKVINNRLWQGIKPGEHLDMPGVVKRLGAGGQTRYPSVSRIAVDPWVRGSKDNDKRKKTREKIASIIKSNLDDKLSKWKSLVEVSDQLKPRFEPFPFDGELLMKQRLDTICKEIPIDGIFDKIKSELIKLGQEPFPYLAFLACDGDNMTARMQDMSLKEHRDFSIALSRFTAEARAIVETNCLGSLIYAGGDDVVAYLPLDYAFDCAIQLQEEFAKQLPGATLSVGIAIVHALTPMAGDMLRLAHDAERTAKRGKIAIALYKRSGAPTIWICPWANDPAAQMKKQLEWIGEGLISHRTLYGFKNLAHTYVDPIKHEQLPWVTSDLLHKEVVRLLEMKVIEKNCREKVAREFLSRISNVEDLYQLSSSLQIASIINAAMKSAQGD